MHRIATEFFSIHMGAIFKSSDISVALLFREEKLQFIQKSHPISDYMTRSTIIYIITLHIECNNIR